LIFRDPLYRENFLSGILRMRVDGRDRSMLVSKFQLCLIDICRHEARSGYGMQNLDAHMA
jgi:hypothetical protein